MEHNYQDTIPPVEPSEVLSKRWKSISGAGTLSSILSMISILLGIFITFSGLSAAYLAMSMSRAFHAANEEAVSPEIGFVLVGLAVVFLILVPMAVMQFFHLQFTTKLKNAVELNDQARFEAAWLSLRWYWRIFGVLVILFMIGFYFSGLTFGDIITVLIRVVNPGELLNNL